MAEQWRSVKGYEGKYIVSNKGNVMSVPRTYIDKLGRDYLIDGITVTKDKALLVRVRDEHYNQRLEEQYECTGGWKVSDPKTRPFKFSNEMEDWEYHG